MAESRYLLPVSTDTRIRHYHRTDRRRVVEFSIQLEVKVDDGWRAVIRYDTAHGSAHIDRFTIGGKRQKEWLRLDFREALVRAERELKQNWLTYRERFLRGGFP